MKNNLRDWWPLAALLVGVWPLWLNPAGVPFAPHSAYTDALIAHIRNVDYWKHWVWQGQWPLWNTQIFGGLPFAGDPLAGMWYPPHWLLLVVPVELGFNLLVVAHLALGAWALRQYLLDTDLPNTAATLGGLMWALAPKALAHWGAGHLSLLMALQWTPVAMLAAHRAWHTAGGRGWVWVGVAGALAFLADPRWLPWVAVAAGWAVLVQWRWPRAWPELWAHGRGAALAAGLAVLLAGALWVPMLELVANSPRQALTLAEAGVYSVSLLDMLKLLLPAPQAGHETFIYLGVAVMGLAALGVTRHSAGWLVLAGLCALFALGVNGPLYPVLFNLPGIGLLRVPGRAWFVVALAVSVLAAHGLARLPDLWARVRAAARSPLMRRLTAGQVLAVLVALWLADVARLAPLLVEFRPRPPLTPAAAWVHAQNLAEPLRVYSPSFSFGMASGLEQLDGLNPLYLAANQRLVQQASGVRVDRYGVMLPPLDDTAPDLFLANAQAQPNLSVLGQWNVRFVAAEFPLAEAGLVWRASFGRTQVYEVTAVQARLSSPTAAVTLAHLTPNRAEAVVRGPGVVFFSTVALAGWQVSVNGQPGTPCPAEVLTAERLCVVVNDPAAQVMWDYRPMSGLVGLMLSGLGGVALAVFHLCRWA